MNLNNSDLTTRRSVQLGESGRAIVITGAIVPRGLSRTESSSYVGISPSLFDQMVADGRMPKPKRINTRTVWDRLQLDDSFTKLPDDDAPSEWDTL